MKKIIFIIFLITTSIFLIGCNDINKNQNTNTEINSLTQPNRQFDLYGKIISVEGNEFIIQQVDTSKDPTFGMSPQEKKDYMMKLSQEQRMALKEEIRNATLGNTKVIIPVGIPILVKKEQGPNAKSIVGSLEDLTPGSYVTIRYNKEIKNKKIAEFVKKSYSK